MMHGILNIKCNIFYNTTSKYIKKEFVHYSIAYKLLPRTTPRKVLSPARFRISPFQLPANQFNERYQYNLMNPIMNLSFRSLKFGTRQPNNAYLAKLSENYQK
jgi:hypothetical protein